MLSFRDCNAKCRVVNVEENEKFSVVKLRTARKDQNSDTWVNSTFSFVKFLGNAHKQIGELVDKISGLETFDNGDVKSGVPIVLKSVSLSNEPYMKDGEKQYPKNYAILVWAWDFPDESETSPKRSMDKPPVVEEDDSEEIPF